MRRAYTLRLLALVVCVAAAVAGFGRASVAATHFEPLAQAQNVDVFVVLKDGTRVRFLRAFEHRRDGGGPDDRALAAVFELEDKAILSNHAKLIEVADFLFGGVLLAPADTKGFTRAWVGFLISKTIVGDNVVEELEDFHYARGEDAVWLRQAGPEPWKTAQDPKAWTPPTIEIVDLGEYGAAEVSFMGQIAEVPGLVKAFGVEMRTDTPLESGRKWEEIRALWNQLDREKLRTDGFTVALLLNFTERARGKFHVRKFAFMQIQRGPDGEWPTLPDGPLGPGGQPVVVASLPPLPLPDSEAMGIVSAAVLRAASAFAADEGRVESVAGSGASLRLRAIEPDGRRGGRSKSYFAKTK
jgi:hypothetical protein